VSKLQRLPRLRLSEIQDIGGCRVVVPTADDASNVASDLMESRIRHELVRYRASQTEGATGIRNRRQLVLQRQFIWNGDFLGQLEPDNVLP
jgi:ppGpp synthetase/RelA/SpoT-type nucleotidyltranferase